MKGQATLLKDPVGHPLFPVTSVECVYTTDGRTKIEDKLAELEVHPDASTETVGMVRLNDTLDSESVTEAATANAVKKAYDKALEAFQSASNGKDKIATAITGKGISASSSETFEELSSKIGQINTGISIPLAEPIFTPKELVVDMTIEPDAMFDEFRLKDGVWGTSKVFTNLEPVTEYTIEVKTTKYDNQVQPYLTKTPKANNVKPAKPTHVLDEDIATITAPSGAKIYYNENTFESPYTVKLSEGSHNFQSIMIATDKFNETKSDILNIEYSSITPPIGPGPSTPIAGDGEDFGYYGKVIGLISGSQLSALTGVTSGTLSLSGDIRWLKFKCYGKTIFVADRCIRTGISWDSINSSNCVRGKVITIGGNQYSCRLLTGGNQTLASSAGGEWDNTIVKYTPNNSDSNWNDKWSWCQEVPLNGTGTSSRVLYGYNSVSYFDYRTSSKADSFIGWRPTLEVL